MRWNPHHQPGNLVKEKSESSDSNSDLNSDSNNDSSSDSSDKEVHKEKVVHAKSKVKKRIVSKCKLRIRIVSQIGQNVIKLRTVMKCQNLKEKKKV